jgi:hypothetical protein
MKTLFNEGDDTEKSVALPKYRYTVFQLRLSTSKAEKSNTGAKGCWEPLWKFISLLAIHSQQPFALVFDFSALLVDNLNWNSCILTCIA